MGQTVKPSNPPDANRPADGSLSTELPNPEVNGLHDDNNDQVETVENVTMKASSPVHEVIDPKAPLENLDWDELESRYHSKMAECSDAEGKILEKFRGLLEVFSAWQSTIFEHEEERAYKRLRTRMSFVQGTEARLEEKRQHYIKVVKAFESALALLGGS